MQDDKSYMLLTAIHAAHVIVRQCLMENGSPSLRSSLSHSSPFMDGFLTSLPANLGLIRCLGPNCGASSSIDMDVCTNPKQPSMKQATPVWCFAT